MSVNGTTRYICLLELRNKFRHRRTNGRIGGHMSSSMHIRNPVRDGAHPKHHCNTGS